MVVVVNGEMDNRGTYPIMKLFILVNSCKPTLTFDEEHIKVSFFYSMKAKCAIRLLIVKKTGSNFKTCPGISLQSGSNYFSKRNCINCFDYCINFYTRILKMGKEDLAQQKTFFKQNVEVIDPVDESTSSNIHGHHKDGYSEFKNNLEGAASKELVNEIHPPRPFRKISRLDCFDMHDWQAPANTSIDEASGDLDWYSRRIAAAPTPIQQMEIIVESGVRKYIHQEGQGESEANDELLNVSDGYRVWIHYNMFIDKEDRLVFLDSTKEHGMATSMIVGEDVIPGLYHAVKSMKKAEIAEFVIEPLYGYGRMGIPGFIGGNERLRIVVELKEIASTSRKSAAFMDEIERVAANLSFGNVSADVEQLLEAGKAKFEKKYYRDASDRYTWALEIIEGFSKEIADEKSGKSEEEMIHSRITPDEEIILCRKRYQLYCNLALCYNKLEEYEETEKWCNLALSLDHSVPDLEPKLLHRHAEALYNLGKYREALELCVRGLKSAWGHDQFMELRTKIHAAAESKPPSVGERAVG